MELLLKEFQLLRPEWLLSIVPLLTLVWLFWKKKLFSRDWESVIDPRLLPHLLVGKSGRKSIWPLLFWLSLGIITIFALSGPAWKKLPLPVFKKQSALVIVLDLSRSMNTQDVKPSRLVRARLKLLDLLKQRKEGQTALVVFAATAYTVSPLTDDSETIQSLVSSLTTDLMPVQGSRADLAVVKALELFQNAGIQKGDIVLISDGVSAKSINKLQDLELQGYRLSVLAAGTQEGAPVPAHSGGFVKDNKGSIVVARTDKEQLYSLASSYGGVFQQMSLDDKDLQRIQKLFGDNQMLMDHEQTDFKADRWQEEGPWILLLVAPLVALVFRRGIFLSLLLAFIIFPVPRPVLALDIPDWESLWKNSNQRAEEKLKQGDAEKAAELFDRADWKAASHYKAGQYEQALEQLSSVNSAGASYNQGNTLAKMGRLEEALKSYDEVLRQQPQHEDALFNRKLVEDALKKQQQQQEQQNKDGEKNSEDQQNKDQQQQDQQNSEQSDQKDSGQQNQDQQSQSEADQQQQDQKEIDQQQAEQDEKEKSEEEKKARQEEAEKQQAEAEQQEAEELSSEQQTESLSEQAEAQWLRRIPDDPGGLLRNKFKYQYGRQQQPSQEKESW